MQNTFNKINKAIVFNSLSSARTLFNLYNQEKIRIEKEKENIEKQQLINEEETKRKIEETTEIKENKKNKRKHFSSDINLINKNYYNSSKLNEKNHNVSINETGDLMVNKKKKRGIEQLFKPLVNQIIETEFIAKIEILTQENEFLKDEKTKLKEQIIQHKELLTVKDSEIMKLKSKLNVIIIS